MTRGLGKERLSRAMSWACSECGSAAGMDCMRVDGTQGRQMPHEARFLGPPPEGTPFYMSPEQKGSRTATSSRGTSRSEPEPALGTLWTGFFSIPLEPRSKGNSKTAPAPGVVKHREGLKERQAQVAELARPHAPPRPLVGSVRLSVTFVMETARRVDRGNLLKLLEDALEGDFYLDDAQIDEGEVRKRLAFGSEQGHYQVVIRGLLPAAEEER